MCSPIVSNLVAPTAESFLTCPHLPLLMASACFHPQPSLLFYSFLIASCLVSSPQLPSLCHCNHHPPHECNYLRRHFLWQLTVCTYWFQNSPKVTLTSNTIDVLQDALVPHKNMNTAVLNLVEQFNAFGLKSLDINGLITPKIYI